jgi:hypothetical protein
MRKPNIIYLFLIAAALGIAAYLTERNENKSETAKFDHFGLQASQLRHIVLVRSVDGNSQTIKLSKVENIWKFDQDSDPINLTYMGVDSEYVDTLVLKLEEAVFEVVPVDTSSSQDQFRLDKPLASIQLMDNSGAVFSLLMSERRNFEGSPYYKLNNQSAVYTSATDLTPMLLNKPIYFQKRHILSHQLSDFTKVEIKNQNGRFEILNKPSISTVVELITKIKNMTVQEYLKYDSKKIDQNAVVVKLHHGGAVWQMQLALNTRDKKLYGLVNTEHMVEFDTSYWEYFFNLKADTFVRKKNDKN